MTKCCVEKDEMPEVLLLWVSQRLYIYPVHYPAIHCFKKARLAIFFKTRKKAKENLQRLKREKNIQKLHLFSFAKIACPLFVFSSFLFLLKIQGHQCAKPIVNGS